MTSGMIEFRANGRAAPGYVSRPETGSGPGVIVVQEWWGLTDHIKEVADRFATAGFVALAPDLYHGEKTKSPDAAGKLMMALNIGEASKDLRGAADYLLGLDDVSPKKVGTVGFCMGGQLALYAACEHPDRIATAVDFYGIHPHVTLDVARLAGPVQAHFGKHDKSVNEDVANALIARIEAAGKRIDAYFYDAPHAFFNDHRPEVYDKASAELAWLRAVEFFRENLA